MITIAMPLMVGMELYLPHVVPVVLMLGYCVMVEQCECW